MVDDRIFGDYANEVETSFLSQIRRLNIHLMDASIEDPNVRIVDVDWIQSTMGRNCFFDPKLYYTSKLPCTLDAICNISDSAIKTILAMRGQVKKCVVTDLDGTLWGGIIGDDGPSGIQIGDLGMGVAYSSLQQWLLELKKRGMPLNLLKLVRVWFSD